MTIHIVKQGETLYSIAKQYNISPNILKRINGLENKNNLLIGQAILILIPEKIHIVKEGESLYSIAISNGINVMRILRNNPPLTLDSTIYPGEEIVISYKDKQYNELYITGYAYTRVKEDLIKQTLPFLTSLIIFGYGISENGNLIYINDEKLISLANEYEVIPIMLLSSLTEEGNFNTARALNILSNNETRQNIIEEIIYVIKEKGYYGIDIDFEYIQSEQKEIYFQFLRELSAALKENGYFLSIDLAPKTSDTQEGLLYESHDYGLIGEIADIVFLMTYEWGYTYGPPMAVAPIDEVRKVAEYAVTKINPKKILLGIPNYGYDWTLPYKEGSAAPTVGNQSVINLALKYNAVIEFDEKSMSPYFYYTTDDSINHVVWFEDVRSIKTKYDLVKEFNLLGAGYWNLMRYFTVNFSFVNWFADIDKRF